MNDQPGWTLEDLEKAIEDSWDAQADISPTTIGFQRETVEQAIDLLDSGQLRVAERIDGEWVTHQWLKKAVLLSFRLHASGLMGGAHGFTHEPGMGPWWDKVASKFGDWTPGQFADAGFRAVPGAIVRRGAFVGKNAILMPSFVNIGAYVDEGTMVDTWSTVGSCLSRCRPTRPLSRTTASSARARKWPRASSSARAR